MPQGNFVVSDTPTKHRIISAINTSSNRCPARSYQPYTSVRGNLGNERGSLTCSISPGNIRNNMSNGHNNYPETLVNQNDLTNLIVDNIAETVPTLNRVE